MAQAPPDNPTNRGVRKDFSCDDVVTREADIRSGFLKPTKVVLTHPSPSADMLNADYTATTRDMINGYFFTSVALTADRTLTLPPATSIVCALAAVLRKDKTGIAGAHLSFVVDNSQAGAFLRTVAAGAGVTLQGSGFDLSQFEIATFDLIVHDSTTVIVSRGNEGSSTAETLAETLAAGNTTGGTDVELTSGDSITGTGPVPITSSDATAGALRLLASNAAGGLDIDTGTGGVIADTTGAISLDGAAASNFTTTTGAVTVESTDATAAGQIVLSSAGSGASAVDINATGGGVTVDYEGTNTMPVTSGGTVIATFGTSAAPDLTVNNGDLIITGGDRGLIHTGSGTVTQLVSNATGVTLNTTSGKITMFGTVGVGLTNSFTVTNSTVAATSLIMVTVEAVAAVTGIAPSISISAVGAGTFDITVTNLDAANATTAAPIIHFVVVNLV